MSNFRVVPSPLDYRDRTDLPVLDTPYLCNTLACDIRIFLVVCNILTLVVTVYFQRTDCRKKMSGSFAQ
jgi:hypothetical protein